MCTMDLTIQTQKLDIYGEKCYLCLMFFVSPLGHPKTRAFITHGGANGIYEAIYHGVPMVGIPMFADQPSNIIHMTARGAARIVDLNFMTTEDLKDAITTVVNDKS